MHIYTIFTNIPVYVVPFWAQDTQQVEASMNSMRSPGSAVPPTTSPRDTADTPQSHRPPSSSPPSSAKGLPANGMSEPRGEAVPMDPTDKELLQKALQKIEDLENQLQKKAPSAPSEPQPEEAAEGGDDDPIITPDGQKVLLQHVV